MEVAGDGTESGSTLYDDEKAKDLEKGKSPDSPDVVVVEHEGCRDSVWWDGDHDPVNPMNWPSSKKWGTIAIVSTVTFIMYMPSFLVLLSSHKKKKKKKAVSTSL